MKITARMFAAAALAVCLAGPAVARDIVWNLSRVTFDDGGTASGWFRYNADTGAIDDWSITTTGGATMPGFDYETSINAFVNAPGDFFFGGNSDFDPYVRLIADGLLGAEGGSVPLLFGPDGSYECDNCNTVRFVTGGTLISANAIPEPAAWAMMVVGFGAIGAVARGRRSIRVGFAA